MPHFATTSSTTNNLANATWGTWVTITTSSTVSSTIVWGNWVNTADAVGEIRPLQPLPVALYEDLEREEWRRVEAAASERALETLSEVLTQAQWEQYQESEEFDLVVPSGNVYRICRGVTGNVTRMVDGVQVESLCAHPHMSQMDNLGRWVGRLPVEDVLVSQVLTLLTDEAEFRRVANITPLRPVGHLLAA